MEDKSKEDKSKRGRFCHALIRNGLQVAKAYREACPGVPKHKSWHRARDYIKSPGVRRKLREILEPSMKKFEITDERILQEAACLAFLDPGEMFGSDDRPLRVREMAEEVRRALAGIEVEDIYEGKGRNRKYVGLLKKFKVANKLQALEFLAKIRGLLKDNNVTLDLAELLAKARTRVAKKVTTEEFFS